MVYDYSESVQTLYVMHVSVFLTSLDEYPGS